MEGDIASMGQFIGAGLAAIGSGMAAIGVGNVFGSFLQGALRNPAAASTQTTNMFSMARCKPLVLLLAVGLGACAIRQPEPNAGHLRPPTAAPGTPPALVNTPLLPPPPSSGRAKAEVFSVSVHNVDIRSSEFVVVSYTNFLNTGSLTLGNHATDSLTFAGGLGAVSQSAITLAGTLLTTNSQIDLAALTLTAAATIVAKEAKGVLLVPNTALRFSPTSSNGTAATNTSILSKMMPRPSRNTRPKTAGTDPRSGGTRQIWVLQENQPVAMQVKTGISDGRNTEVSGEGLSEGMAVITEQRSGTAP